MTLLEPIIAMVILILIVGSFFPIVFKIIGIIIVSLIAISMFIKIYDFLDINGFRKEKHQKIKEEKEKEKEKAEKEFILHKEELIKENKKLVEEIKNISKNSKKIIDIFNNLESNYDKKEILKNIYKFNKGIKLKVESGKNNIELILENYTNDKRIYRYKYENEEYYSCKSVMKIIEIVK